MSKLVRFGVVSAGLFALACGGTPKGDAAGGGNGSGDDDMDGQDKMMMKMMDGETDEATTPGPLEVGADWQSYTKANTTPAESGDHGNRFVDTYVNDIGVEAYTDDDEEMAIPVGTIIVKTSWERAADGTPSDIPGPVFVMEKREEGFDPGHNDWYYAIHWEKIPAKWSKKLGESLYWRTPSKKVDYCWKCHEGYDRELGMVPDENRDWQ
jgi:hypothetical protein